MFKFKHLSLVLICLSVFVIGAPLSITPSWSQPITERTDEAGDPLDDDIPLGSDLLDEDTPLGPDLLEPEPSKTRKDLEEKKDKEKSDSDTPRLGDRSWTLKTVSIIGDAERLTRVSGSAHRVDQETLEAQEYDDVHRVLKQIPGVYVRDEDGQGLRPNIGLRGANSDRSAKVTLMEDGVLMAPAPYSAPAAYYFPLTTRLTGVEVFKGPASIQYGPNTIGGAINLVTRSVPMSGRVGGVDLSTGMYNSNKVHAYYGQGWGRFGVLIEVAQLNTDGFKDLDGGGDTGFDKREMMTKLRYHSDPNAEVYHALELKLGVADERSAETYLGLTDEDFKATPFRRYSASQMGEMEWLRTQAKLSYNVSIGDDIELKFDLYRHDFDRSWEKLNGLSAPGVALDQVLRDPSNPRYTPFIELLSGTREWTGDPNERLLIGDNHRIYLSQGAQGSGEWRTQGRGWGNRLQLGVRFHQDQIEREHTERAFEMNSQRLIPIGDSRSTRKNLGETIALSASLFDEVKIGDRVRLTPGVRLERYQTTLIDTTLSQDSTTFKGEELVLLPGVGGWLTLNDHVGLLVGAHRGFSPLSLDQTGLIQPELSLNYESGARAQWGGEGATFKGELIGFFNDYQNLVGACTQSAGCAVADLDRQFNAGRAHIMGVESLFAASFLLSHAWALNTNLTYTWTRARFQSSFESEFSQWGSVGEGATLPYIPEHQASARVGLNAQRFGVEGVLTYVGEMRDVAGLGTPASAELIPAYSLIDMSARYALHERGQLYLTIDNLLGEVYLTSRRPFGARPGKPFLIRIGYKSSF